MRDKLRALPSTEMRTLGDLQQAASARHDEPENFGMLTPRRQYHRRLQLELEGKIPAKEQPQRPPPSPRFAVPAVVEPELSSSDESSSEDVSSSHNSTSEGASAGKKHKKHRRHHQQHHGTHLSVSPARGSPLAERKKDKSDKSESKSEAKSEKSDKSESKSEAKSGSDSKASEGKKQ